MKKTNKYKYKIVNNILQIIDWFYPPFRFLFSKQVFRYGVCGSFSTFYDICLFYFFLHYVFKEQDINLVIMQFAPYTASFFSSFILSFPVGFLLNRYVVFPSSMNTKNVQLFRYLFVVVCNILFNYLFLKILVEYFHWYATLSKIIITFVLIIFSFIMQRKFTFK